MYGRAHQRSETRSPKGLFFTGLVSDRADYGSDEWV